MPRFPPLNQHRLSRSRHARLLAGSLIALGGAVALVAFVALAAPSRASTRVERGAEGRGTELIVIATERDPFAITSEVRRVIVDGAAGAARGRAKASPSSSIREVSLGSIPHAPGAVVRGDLLFGASANTASRDGSEAVIAADARDASPRSDFAEDVYTVGEGRAPRLLWRGGSRMSRPFVSIDGSVYIEGGAEGPEPWADARAASGLRTDHLRIERVDVASGQGSTVLSEDGYALHLAGEWRDEVLIYRVNRQGAAVLAMQRRTLAVRTVRIIPPFARDFSVDSANGRLTFVDRDENDRRLWWVVQLDIQNGALVRVLSARDDAPAPFVLGGGTLLFGAPGRRGELVVAERERDWRVVGLPFGAGFEAVVAASPDGDWVAICHIGNGTDGRDETAAVQLATGQAHLLSLHDEQIDIVGFRQPLSETVR